MAVVGQVEIGWVRLDAGDDLRTAWEHAADVATQAAAATAQLTARLGRARSHGDKSLGTPDPGAVSFVLVTQTALTLIQQGD